MPTLKCSMWLWSPFRSLACNISKFCMEAHQTCSRLLCRTLCILRDTTLNRKYTLFINLWATKILDSRRNTRYYLKSGCPHIYLAIVASLGSYNRAQIIAFFVDGSDRRQQLPNSCPTDLPRAQLHSSRIPCQVALHWVQPRVENASQR